MIFFKKTNIRRVPLYLAALCAIVPFLVVAAQNTYAPGDTVTIGDFVFNDDMSPTTDICSVLAYNPGGSVLVNASTTLGANGWQSYEVTAPATNGVYPAFLMCGHAVSGDLVKSDKTFIVKTPDVTNASIATSVWGSGSRTLTSLGAAAADVWNDSYAAVRRLTDKTLSGGGSIATESYVNTATSTIVSEIQTNRTLIQALNNISAADVWAYGTRSLNGSTTVNLSTASKQEIWDTAASSLSTSGSIGKRIADNLDAQVSSRGVSNLTAADVWNSTTRTLSDYATSTLATAIWNSASRTLSNYGNDITAADVWNVLASSVTTSGSIGKQLKDNINDSLSNVISEIQTNRTLIQALNNISAADVWAYGTRSLNGSTTVNLSTASKQEIWDTAASSLSTSGSIGKQIADNLDAQVSSRGVSNITAADVWNSASRTLSDYATSTLSAAIWSSASRTLTNYGNDITAADVWNTLTSTISTTGSIGKQLKDNVDGSISNVVTEIQLNRTAIQALNNISAADVWAYGARSVNSAVDISSTSTQAIWDVAASGLSTSGSIGKRIADNLDAQVSSRGVSNLTAADVWANASRTLSDYGTSSIAGAVWSNASRTLSSYGNDITAADVWNVLSTSITTTGSIGKQLKDNVDGSISNVVTEIQTNRALIQALNNISAADVWAHGTRSLNTDVDISTASKQEIWDVATAGLSTSGSIGKKIVDNLDAQVSSRGVSNITAADVWNSASRTLSDYGTSSIAAAVWSNAARTLSNYGNDITAADVWNVLSTSITTTGSIGKQLKDNVDGSISNVVAEIQTNRALIQALNNISASDVWAYGTRSLNGSTTVNLSTASKQEIWDTAASSLSTTGSIGKQIADNLDAQISSRGISNLTAADVWNAANRSLSDYGTSSIASAVWSNTSRTLSSYGNDITAADVWNALSGSLTTVGSIGKQLKDNVDGSISNVVTEIQLNRTAIQALNNISAADVWAYGTRSLNGSTTVNLSSASQQAIWDVAASSLSTTGSIGKRIADNLDAQVSSRGISNLTAADVWASASRTLSDYGTSSVAAAVWSNASRTLSNYGNDITAADVWNVLSGSLTTVGSIGKQLKDNVNGSISDVITEIQTNRTLIQSLNDVSAADIWSYGARSLNGSTTVNLSTASQQAIWDIAASGLSTSGSIGKRIADNLDAQVSSRGVSNLTAADVWNTTTRTLSDYATSSLSAAIWANGSRTLTNYGNDITAADVWNVLSSSITTSGSIGKQLKDNVNDSISNIIAEVQTNRTLIQGLNNVSAADVWAYGARSLNSSVDISSTSTQAIWDVAASGLSTSGSIGKRIADNLDAQISSRGVSNLTAADVWMSASRTLSDYATSTLTAAIWANSSRTLTNYGNDITAADVWNVLSSSLTTANSIGSQLSSNVDTQISSRAATSSTNSNWSVTMSNIERIQTGKVYRTKVFILNASSEPTAPATVPTASLYDPSRNLVTSNIPMTLISTGVYEYTYSVSTLAPQGLWETVVSTEVDTGKTIQTNDYWEVAGSPAQVIINSITSPTADAIAGNITITNEGLTGYEYQYEWCIVDNVNNQCGGGDDTFHALAAKFINPGESWNTALTGNVSTAGTYYFKLVVYFGADSSSASRVFTVDANTTTPPSSGGTSGGGGGGSSSGGFVTVTAKGCGLSADFNQDCKVDSVDFSILLSFWKTAAPFKNIYVDINKDNKVNSTDFSILLSQWTKKK